MVLNFIEKYKFAILGTVLFHVLFFMYANFVTVKRPYQPVEPVTEVSIPLEDIMMDPETMKLLEMEPPKEGQPQEIYNVTSDVNDTRERSYENFSTQEMDQMVEENAKALEQQFFDEWAATHGDGEAADNADLDISDDRQKVNTNTNNAKTGVDATGDKAFAGDVMASFDLKDRKAHSLEKPGYTCNSSGTVVLQIKVDRNGEVDDVTYVPSASVNATECMVTQALKYAKRSRFNYSATAPAVQTGTITYKFVSR